MESLLLHSFLTEAPVVIGGIIGAVASATVITKSLVEKATEPTEEEAVEQE